MIHRFVADGEFRLKSSAAHQTRLRELQETIAARFATELETAGLIRWLWLRICMARELRRERRRIEPSPEALYAVAGFF